MKRVFLKLSGEALAGEKNGQMVTPEANKPKRPSNMLELQW